MKIDLTSTDQTNEFAQSWLGHAVLNACSKNGEHGINLTDKERFIEVTMQVNGKEVNPENFFDHLGTQWDATIAKKALSLLQDKFADIINPLMDLQEKIKEIDAVVAKEVGW